MQVVSILFAVAFTFVTCLAIGKTLLKITRATLYRSEELFFGFVLGAVCLSTIVLLLGLASLAYWWMFFLVGIAAIVSACVTGAIRFTGARLSPLKRGWAILFASLYGLFAILYFLNALAPEASSDGAMFHVALPAFYLREHRIPPITTNFLASFSEGMEMLFLFGFAFGRHSATATVHLLFGLLAPFGMLSYAKRIGAPAAGVVGSLLFFLSPMTAQSSTTAYVDIGLATVIFAVFYLARIWRSEMDPSLLVPLGIIAGFGYAIKYTAFVAVPYALGVIAFRLWRSHKPIPRPAIIVSFCAITVIAPWMIKNAAFVGNPVSPFANRVFRNPYVYASTEDVYRYNMGSLQGMTIWRVPYEVTVRGWRTQGFIGPMFLLAPLAFLALTVPAGRQLLCAAAVFLLPFFSYPVARILLPALPFVSLALGLAFSRWRSAAIGLILLHAISAWPGVIPKYASRYAVCPGFPDWRAALRLTPESVYLQNTLSDYGIDRLLDAKVPAGEHVFSFNAFAQAYHSRQVLVEWQSAEGVRLGEALRTAVETWRQPANHFDFHFAPRTVQKIRLNGAAAVSELRVFRNGAELPRSPEWRLRAFPNPWDVQLAFDNSPLTRWATHEPPRSGSFVEIDFGRPETIDQVRVESTADQSGLTLDGIDAKAETSHVDMPARLRRAAVEELKRRNIEWLVVNDLDPLARDFQLREAQWGIRVAGESSPFRLYHLD